MGEVNGLVTQTALAIRDEDELEVAASILDAALRRAKADGMREASDMVEDDCYALSESDVSDPTHAAKVLHNVNQQALSNKIDARAAQIEEGE